MNPLSDEELERMGFDIYKDDGWCASLGWEHRQLWALPEVIVFARPTGPELVNAICKAQHASTKRMLAHSVQKHIQDT